MTRSRLRIAALVVLALEALLAAPCLGDEADDWVELAERVSVADAPSPAAALQAQSMVRCAVDAALARSADLGRQDASDLAAAAAAHSVLARLYPERRPYFDARLKRVAAGVKPGPASERALQAGRAAAAEALLVSWPRGIDEKGGQPPGLAPEVRMPLPGRSAAPIEPPGAHPHPAWRDRHAINLNL